MTTTTTTKCKDFRCPSLPTSVVASVAGIGSIWLCMSVLACIILYRVQFKFRRLNVLAMELGITRSQRRWLVTLALQALCILPIVYAIIWGIIAGEETRPYYADYKHPFLIGFSVASFALALSAVVYGICHWILEAYRFTAAVRVSLSLAAALVFALQAAYTFILHNTYETLYVIYVSWNLFLMLHNAKLHRFYRPGLDYAALITLKSRREPPIWQTRTMVMNYIIAFLFLLFFAVAVRVSHQSSVGFQIWLSITATDVALAYVWASQHTVSPLVIGALSFLARATLFVVGSRRWFLGNCFNYVVFGGLLVYQIIRQQYRVHTKEHILDEKLGGLMRTLSKSIRTNEDDGGDDDDDGVLALSSDNDAAVQALVTGNVSERLRSPITGLLIITVGFLIYIFLALYATLANSHMEERLFPPIPITDAPHPQYQYGLFALLVTGGLGFVLWARRLFIYHERRFTPMMVWAMVGFNAFTISSAIGMWTTTKSVYMLVLGCFLPPIFTFSSIVFLLWQRHDYRWNSYIHTMLMRLREAEMAERQRRAVTRYTQHADNMMAAPESSRDLGQVRRGLVSSTAEMMKAFVLGQHHWIDYALLGGVLVVAVLIELMGFALRAEGASRNAAWSLANGIGFSIMLLFFLVRWHTTFSVGYLLLFGLLAQQVFVGVFWYSEGYSVLSILSTYLWFNGFVCIYMAAVAIHANRWRVRRRDRGLFWCGLLLVAVSFILVDVQVAGTVKVPVIGFLMLLVLVGGGAFLLYDHWSSHNFYLKRAYVWAIGGSLSVIDLYMVVTAIVVGSEWFLCFSLFWVFMCVIILLAAIMQLRVAAPRVIFPSKWVLPVYTYDPRAAMSSREQQFKMTNRGTQLYLIFCVCTCFWGVCAGFLVNPSYVGWLIFSLSMLMGWYFLLGMVHDQPRAFWRAWTIICQHPDLVEEARRNAFYGELREMDSMLDDAPETDATTTTTNSTNHRDNGGGASYLRMIRLYWEWESKSNLSVLLYQRNRLLAELLLSADGQRQQAPRDLEAGAATVDEHNTEDDGGVLLRLNELHALDDRIRVTYREQSRMVVRFMVNVAVAASSLEQQSQVLLRDFLRHSDGFGDKRADHEDDNDDDVPVVSGRQIEAMSPLALAEYLSNADNLARMRKRALAYVQHLVDTTKRARAHALDEQQVVAERRERRQRAADAMAAAAAASRAASVAEDHPPAAEASAATTTTTTVSLVPVENVHDLVLEEVELDLLRDRTTAIVSRVLERDEPFTDPTTSVLLDDSPAAAADDDDDKEEKEEAKDIVLLRPKEFVRTGRPDLVARGFSPEEIVQGELQDCYLLSAMSVLANAQAQQRLERLFLVRQFNEQGIYSVAFYVEGKWRAVVVDDRLPTMNGELVYARSRMSNVLWVSIMEKAYAKLFEGYRNIEGGLVHECLVDLTGGVAEEITISATGKLEEFDGRLWNRLLTYHQQGFLLGCGNPTGLERQRIDQQVRNGIVQGHAYAILDVVRVDDYRLLKLANPWGMVEWMGDWSDTSPLWTQRLTHLLNHVVADDGVFWMSFEDFKLNFKKVYVCRLFDDDAHWHRQQLKGAWRGVTAGGPPSRGNNDSCVHNPQYDIMVTEPSLVFISLAQRHQQSQDEYQSIAFFVAQKDPTGAVAYRIRSLKKAELVSSNVVRFVDQREVSAEVQLEANIHYTIFTSCSTKGAETDFTLTCYSRNNFTLTEISADQEAK